MASFVKSDYQYSDCLAIKLVDCYPYSTRWQMKTKFKLQIILSIKYCIGPVRHIRVNLGVTHTFLYTKIAIYRYD